MASLALESRGVTEPKTVDFRKHLQTLPGGLEVLAGPSGASAARTVDAEIPKVLDFLTRDGSVQESRAEDLILDCGRIQPGAIGQVAALAAADLVLVVTRPTVEAVSSTRWIAELLSRSGGGPGVIDVAASGRDGRVLRQTNVILPTSAPATAGLVVQGDGPIAAHEAAATLGLRLVGAIPTDNLGATWLRGEPVRRLRVEASPLVRCAHAIVMTHLRAVEKKKFDAAEVGGSRDPIFTDWSLKDRHD
jgi:MinD-like ATPase involved in chromosome partitioning or flagellar assembly